MSIALKEFERQIIDKSRELDERGAQGEERATYFVESLSEFLGGLNMELKARNYHASELPIRDRVYAVELEYDMYAFLDRERVLKAFTPKIYELIRLMCRQLCLDIAWESYKESGRYGYDDGAISDFKVLYPESA